MDQNEIDKDDVELMLKAAKLTVNPPPKDEWQELIDEFPDSTSPQQSSLTQDPAIETTPEAVEEQLPAPVEEHTAHPSEARDSDAAPSSPKKPWPTKEERKQKKKAKRQDKIDAINAEFKRAQHYFGLRCRPEEAALPGPPGDEENQKPELKEIDTAVAREKMLRDELFEQKFSIDNPPPYEPSTYPILVSVDVEAWERNHNCVTEVGVSTLDTKVLNDMPPGELGANWMETIDAKHWIMLDYIDLHNTEFTADGDGNHKFDFQHGESLEFYIEKLPARFNEVLETVSDNWKRPIVLVGHNIASDLNFIDNVFAEIERADVLDTQHLWQALNDHSPQATQVSLKNVCGDLGLKCTGWHNAGNDARNTMQALVAMMVCEAKMRHEMAMKKYAQIKDDEDQPSAPLPAGVLEDESSL
ncbi:hypothetical protein BT63DRAFT_425998 [Microthyrium microscopicum]|uniref:Exonuclease domain-containing protein n=1 Tax=Microthyrium microscopicum TaxID=703497 RepID=A0A6A6UBL7_9PEZI|nr:hypothetical protein BT63DRAFT_425998 [Microthyrium microscopicum]